ncbi:hypothetical protein A1O7_02141 [Cladophialophora yegresii CBS 114405]|uniref:F-box domain-containing protein n=1 Tax=Cladophialophora yegresii CBS 114405 TaxID=1182544 RepID=W9W0V7_9EURO|nr:uncharacterized protein A1O7_02141 [Cladophialophora yegresii CBS 114405]EXJ61712.1 hypothetical protein A1O7_02141 [Cladophialophora yegresii CBS 114405]
MASTEASHPTSFTDLPNECILLIVEELAEPNGWYYDLPTDVKNLSLVIAMPRTSDKVDAGILKGLSKPTFFSSRINAFQITLLQNDYPDFYNSFVKALTNMTQLRQLKVTLDNNVIVASRLRMELKRTEAKLPTVQVLHLTTAPDAGALLLVCPQLTSLVADDMTLGWKSALRAMPTLRSLRHLQVRKNTTNWTARAIRGRFPRF